MTAWAFAVIFSISFLAGLLVGSHRAARPPVSDSWVVEAPPGATHFQVRVEGAGGGGIDRAPRTTRQFIHGRWETIEHEPAVLPERVGSGSMTIEEIRQ